MYSFYSVLWFPHIFWWGLYDESRSLHLYFHLVNKSKETPIDYQTHRMNGLNTIPKQVTEIPNLECKFNHLLSTGLYILVFLLERSWNFSSSHSSILWSGSLIGQESISYFSTFILYIFSNMNTNTVLDIFNFCFYVTEGKENKQNKTK